MAYEGIAPYCTIRSSRINSCHQSRAGRRLPRLGYIAADLLLDFSNYRSKSERTMIADCTHLDQILDVSPNSEGCEECLAMGDTWVHLRLCLSCGHVGCCDSSRNKHATKHFLATNHPIMRSFEPGEEWMWCYIDQIFMQ